MKQHLFSLFFLFISVSFTAQVQTKLEYLDVFQLEYAGDPQISPDGKYVVYRRTGFDIMKDKSVGSIWLLSTDTRKIHHKLTSRDVNEGQARWSPNGDRIAFVSSKGEGSEIYVYWTATGSIARLTQLENSPSNLSWSPDGSKIAFTMKVNEKPPVIAKMPDKPKDAKWAKKARITDRLKHEADGAGYLKPGYTHLFTISSEGGAPRQITSGPFNHSSNLSWSSNGQKIYFSANRNPNWEYEFRNSEIYAVNWHTGIVETLTERPGPDSSPKVSPDGSMIAYLGYEDKVQTYQTRKLQVMNADGSNKRLISSKLDRSISRAWWSQDNKGLYIQYNDLGKTKIGYMNLAGKLDEIVDNVGGTTLGRPYASGSFTVSNSGLIAYTNSYPDRPADVALVDKKSKKSKELTALNEDLLQFRTLGAVDEIWYKSSVDGRDLQGWIVYPPDFEKRKDYPLIVENHGGPILNYGPHFSTEVQLYAAAGYIVFYPNPRGSTSYGEEFGNLLYNNYPGDDYNDVMDGVDAVLQLGKVDPNQLYVTGGSAGGIMTAWIIGKTNRFKAAVVAKPVMNWISKTLVADNYYGYADTRYPGQPWENFENYWKFSPISLVGNVETPTMVMVGMDDLRTPPSEAKQLYHALKLRKIETVLVEIPEASHGIASRPSNLITKVAHTLAWFEKFRK
ncbi:MAG: S9 family peptidase [Flavobacteriaceae bacterium]|nr:S9 family peptidase [Flavobacteriaceae bacterium]